MRNNKANYRVVLVVLMVTAAVLTIGAGSAPAAQADPCPVEGTVAATGGTNITCSFACSKDQWVNVRITNREMTNAFDITGSGHCGGASAPLCRQAPAPPGASCVDSSDTAVKTDDLNGTCLGFATTTPGGPVGPTKLYVECSATANPIWGGTVGGTSATSQTTQTTSTSSSGTTGTTVPSASSWALGLLGALFLLMGTRVLGKRRATA